MGLVIAFTYIMASRRVYSKNLILTLIILPAVTGVIIMLVGTNVARAFSMAGVFSLIRFRSEPGDPKDISYIFLSAAIGLAAGLGYAGYAVLFTIILCMALFILSRIRWGRNSGSVRVLKITVPEDLNFKGAFDDVLEKYSSDYSLDRIKTTDLGALYELSYTLHMDDGINEKDFIDELRCRNGNLNIVLSMGASRSGL